MMRDRDPETSNLPVTVSTPEGTRYSQAWEAWWHQAHADRLACEILSAAHIWGSACFFALQAIEKALKALAREPTSIGDLAGTTVGGVGGLTVEALTVGGKQPQIHSLVGLLDGLRPWHRDTLAPFRERFAELDRAHWYEATRYPEHQDHHGRWHPEPKWHTGFTEADAADLRSLADAVLLAVGNRLPSLSTTDPIQGRETPAERDDLPLASTDGDGFFAGG